MFAITVPSTITLSRPVEDGEHPADVITLAFSHPTDDVSKCMVTVTTADGDMHEAVFNTQGGVVEQTFTSAEEIAEVKARQDAIDEERAAREREIAARQAERELRTADDTTAADVAYDAPRTHVTPVPPHVPPAPVPGPTPLSELSTLPQEPVA